MSKMLKRGKFINSYIQFIVVTGKIINVAYFLRESVDIIMCIYSFQRKVIVLFS